jgi:hypothetical protein
MMKPSLLAPLHADWRAFFLGTGGTPLFRANAPVGGGPPAFRGFFFRRIALFLALKFAYNETFL